MKKKMYAAGIMLSLSAIYMTNAMDQYQYQPQLTMEIQYQQLLEALPPESQELQKQLDKLLILAAGNGQKKEVATLLDQGACVHAVDLDEQNPFERKTPLHAASEMDQSDTVSQLLERRADPNAILNGYQTFPLNLAARYGYFETVLSLIQGYANVTAIDYNSRHVLHYAALSGNLDVVQFLLVSLLVRNHLINTQDESGDTPLHKAIWRSEGPSIEVIRVLLDSGANPTIENLIGQIPFRTIVDSNYFNNPEIKQIITERWQNLYAQQERQKREMEGVLQHFGAFGIK